MPGSGGDYLQAQIVGEGPDLSDDFHNYWMAHAKDSISFGVDDTTWGIFTPIPFHQKRTGFSTSRSTSSDLAVGGSWAGAPDRSTEFPAVMLVDWVSWNRLS